MTRPDRIAHAMAEGWAARARFAPLAGALAPADMDEAYAAQAAYQALIAPRRGAVAGRKIALSAKAMQEMCGIDHPLFGGVFGEEIHESPARISAAAFVHLGVEFELAVEIGEDLVPGDAPWTEAAARAVVSSVRPAFELIEDRAADYAALDPVTMVADNAWCGGVVLGPTLPDGLDVSALPSRLTHDGETEDGNTSAAAPYASLAQVLEHLRLRGVAAKAGEIVITGSALRTRFPEVGARLAYEVAGAVVEMEVTP